MMEKCFDEAILQAFLDNELPVEKSQKVARHIAACDECAILLAEVEEETAFTLTALEQEFNTLVPTQRLWTKINESIETQSRNQTVWQKFSAFVSGLELLNPQIVAFGGLLLIVGVVSVLLLVKNENVSSRVAAVNSPVELNKPKETAKIEMPNPTIIASPDVEKKKEIKPKNIVTPQIRAEKTDFVKTIKKPNEKPIVVPQPSPKPVVAHYLDGEESYVTTIARLEKTVDVNKDEVLKPSARFSYEKNLAVVNDTITKMKAEVRKNPKNTDAKQILFSSYQNKIELLNSVTQRGELMASLR